MTIGGDEFRERDLVPADDPAPALTEKARSWQRFELRERQQHGAVRGGHEPAPTLTAAMDNGNFR